MATTDMKVAKIDEFKIVCFNFLNMIIDVNTESIKLI